MVDSFYVLISSDIFFVTFISVIHESWFWIGTFINVNLHWWWWWWLNRNSRSFNVSKRKPKMKNHDAANWTRTKKNNEWMIDAWMLYRSIVFGKPHFFRGQKSEKICRMSSSLVLNFMNHILCESECGLIARWLSVCNTIRI